MRWSGRPPSNQVEKKLILSIIDIISNAFLQKSVAHRLARYATSLSSYRFQCGHAKYNNLYLLVVVRDEQLIGSASRSVSEEGESYSRLLEAIAVLKRRTVSLIFQYASEVSYIQYDMIRSCRNFYYIQIGVFIEAPKLVNSNSEVRIS